MPSWVADDDDNALHCNEGDGGNDDHDDDDDDGLVMMAMAMMMMENAHIRKGSSLITFTLATPATVTGTPWMMVDEDDDVDDDGDDHDGDVNDDVDDDADDEDNDGDDDPCIPAVTGSP